MTMLGEVVHIGQNDWKRVACSCCAGMEWGGEAPRECSDCGGGGSLYVNEAGVVVQWPGGPFTGHPKEEGRKLWENPWELLRWWDGKMMHYGREGDTE